MQAPSLPSGWRWSYLRMRLFFHPEPRYFQVAGGQFAICRAIGLLAPSGGASVVCVQPVAACQEQSINSVDRCRYGFPVLCLLLAEQPLFHTVRFLSVGRNFIEESHQQAMGVDRGCKGICPSPVVSPIHAFVRRGRSCFAQPGDNLSGNLFLPVPPHEPCYFAFPVDRLFAPLLFRQVRIVADRLTGRTGAPECRGSCCGQTDIRFLMEKFRFSASS